MTAKPGHSKVLSTLRRNPELGEAWQWRTRGEPSLREVLNEPIIRLVMLRDGVTPQALQSVIEQAQASARGKAGEPACVRWVA
jgi:hypothetical protein